MDLTFLGRGSAFNTIEKNNAAFIKHDGNMLLIDCGETTFSSIKENGILDDVKELFVIITHTHSDHIGSLSSLALFCHFVKKNKLNLVLNPDQKHNKLILNILLATGTNPELINTVSISEFLEHFSQIKTLAFLPTPHVAEFQTYGLEFLTSGGVLYYSADTSTDLYVKKYIGIPNLDKIYIDTSKADYEGNVHLSTKKLAEAVMPQMRHKVWCMHIDNSSNIGTLKQMGFNVVEKI